ncbi:MAG: endolytic transglycosylase MltG [Candidatus Dadabacteria bacterium]|nr:endolytic transglycosylase MltG [Candidatus Dadabacteria bacterium]
MRSGKLKLLLILVFALFLLAGASALGLYYYINEVPSVKTDTVVDIPKGKGVRGIASMLEDEGVVASGRLFLYYSVASGVQNRLQAGEYEFKKGATLSDVLAKITKGDVLLHRVTIPEGLTVKETAALLDKKGLFPSTDFLAAASDSSLVAGLPGPPLTGAEGYLYPETYTYKKGVTPEEFAGMMTDRFRSVYASFDGMKNRVNLTDNEIIILASMIEKEAGDVKERPLVSAVFHNRLKAGMRLESDPTVIYGMGDDFDGNLRRGDLRTMTQYNTYVIKGLPPGPIANPGKGSIEAALNPAPVDYLYFVSRGDGTHVFSTSYRDHVNAVNRYQRRR